MVIVSDSTSYAEALVYERLVLIACGNPPCTIFANALHIRNIDDIQAAFSWIK
jgi:hypothetical protein